MEQADCQFRAFIRFMLDALREVNAEADEAKRKARMERILGNLQKILEN